MFQAFVIRIFMSFVSEKCTTPSADFFVVEQLSLIHVNGDELQYKTQPMDKCHG